MISESTEITDKRESRAGCVLYDAHCPYCTAAARFFQPLFRRRGFIFLPLQTPWLQSRLGLSPGAPLKEMRVLTRDGRDFGGAEAVVFLSAQIWWARPLTIIDRIPGAHRLLDKAYRWVAVHRGCNRLSCELSSEAAKLPGFKALRSRDRRYLTKALLPSATLVGLALIARPHLPPWVFMWIMAAALFLSAKWITFWRAKPLLSKISPSRVISYFLIWPGLDAKSFLAPRGTPLRLADAAKMLSGALLKTAFGGVLLFGIARLTTQPLAAGWVGMIGLVFILHFGLFDLAATLWQMAGVKVTPIMDRPIASVSLSEFWGHRWNGAFNHLVFATFFRGFARRLGTIRATLIAFFVSGLLHELVISLPAGGGYGLPTGYFLLQGWAVVAQRLPFIRLGLRRGFGGWIFTMFFTAAPAFWLFHPLFVRRVILPFMEAIGAL